MKRVFCCNALQYVSGSQHTDSCNGRCVKVGYTWSGFTDKQKKINDEFFKGAAGSEVSVLHRMSMIAWQIIPCDSLERDHELCLCKTYTVRRHYGASAILNYVNVFDRNALLQQE